MEKNNRISYCIPTYNRSAEIGGILDKLLPILDKYGIDLYVYDSSSNNETEIVSKNYSSYENFHYIKLPSEITPHEKTRLIFTGAYQVGKYDYIWLVKDRVYCSEDLIKRVLDTAENDHDAIFLRAIETKHTYNITRDYYDDPVQLYHDWGWLITSWDVLLLSRKNILDKINWDEIFDRYSVDVEWDKIITTSEIKKDLSFILVVLLFDTLGKKEKCSVPVLDATAGKHIFNMPLSKRKIEKWLFDTWGYEWYHVNTNLPCIYNNEKEFVIKSATSLPWIMGSYIKFLNLWHDGCLTDKTLEKVKDIWDKVSDIPWQDVCIIKNADKALIENIFVTLIWHEIENNNLNNAEYYYYELLWIKDNIVTRDLQYTIYAMEIYFSERKNNNIHIFDGGFTKDFVFMKIDLAINFLKTLEEHEGIENQEVKKCIDSKLISSSMLVYLIIKCCENAEITFERIIDFLCEN